VLNAVVVLPTGKRGPRFDPGRVIFGWKIAAITARPWRTSRAQTGVSAPAGSSSRSRQLAPYDDGVPLSDEDDDDPPSELHSFAGIVAWKAEFAPAGVKSILRP